MFIERENSINEVVECCLEGIGHFAHFDSGKESVSGVSEFSKREDYDDVSNLLTADFGAIEVFPSHISTFSPNIYYAVLDRIAKNNKVDCSFLKKYGIAMVVQHELRHVDAAKLIGLSAFFTVDLSVSNNSLCTPQFFTGVIANGSQVNKLECAAITARPGSHNSGDIKILQSMGYRDRSDVVDRIYLNNKNRFRRAIPLPDIG